MGETTQNPGQPSAPQQQPIQPSGTRTIIIGAVVILIIIAGLAFLLLNGHSSPQSGTSNKSTTRIVQPSTVQTTAQTTSTTITPTQPMNVSINSTCIASAGFECTHPVFSYNTGNASTTGNVLISFVQRSGQIWRLVRLVFVPYTNASSTTPPSLNSTVWDSSYNISGVVDSGEVENVTLYATGLATHSKNNEWGIIWVSTSPYGYSTNETSQVGIFYVGSLPSP